MRADDFAHGAAEVGFVFCTCVLVTGPLWAKPVWGIWWTWDARLTLTFVLWLLFVAYSDAAELRHQSRARGGAWRRWWASWASSMCPLITWPFAGGGRNIRSR